MKKQNWIYGIVLSLFCACQQSNTDTMTDNQLLKEFENPSNAWRGKPFWSWNGKLDEKELLRQVDVVKEMGFGGYFMHSRVGLQTEYLSDEWFRLTNAVADYGTEKGLESYLYDEDRWPSGSAGGAVTENPDYRMNFMTMKILPAAQFQWNDSITAAFTCQLNGTSFTDLERLTSHDQATAKKGKSVLLFFREKAACTNFVNGYTYLDVMNREATDRFITLTHEAYKQKCGARIGTTIQGIFSDEPHRGPLFTQFGNDNASKPYMAPWTDQFAARYAEKFQGDIIDQLPYLFLRGEGETYHKVKWEYCELAQELFLRNFLKPIYDWCDTNQMAFTGHVLHEDNFVSQVAMQGSIMRSYEYMHIPGVDVLTQYNRNYWIVKQLSSVARQTGRKQLLSELYGCTGWQMSFEDYKESGDWQALFGINLRCPHLSWYTMEGEAKRDYPASIFFQSGWYKEYKYVEDYYARLGLLLAQGKPKCDLLVVNPIESVFAQVAVDAFNGLSPASPLIADMERNYANLFHWLQGEHLDFDYGDEEMMGRLYKVVKEPDGSPVLYIGEAAYRTVLVSNMATMRSSTLNMLKEFVAIGGKVVLAGDAPVMLDVMKSDAPRTFFKQVISVPCDKENVVSAVLSTMPSMASILDNTSNRKIEDIYCQVRNEGERTYFVFMNMSKDQDYKNVKLVLPVAGYLSEWDCRSGKVYEVEAARGENNTAIQTSFAPLEEHVYVVSLRQIAALPASQERKWEKVYEFPVVYDYELNEPNVLPLDMAYYAIDGKKSPALTEVLKIDRAIRQQYGLKFRGGEMLQPWFLKKKYGNQLEKKGTVSLTFPFDVQAVPTDDLFLCIETPAVFTIRLNGKASSTQVEGWWVDPCFQKIKLDRSMLMIGENQLQLETEFTEDKNLETLYLVGNFGVTHQQTKRTITSLPKQIRIGDVTSQGLPFYSGTVSYKVPFSEYQQVSGESLQLTLPSFKGACAKVRKGKQEEMIAFTPYTLNITEDVKEEGDWWLDVVLTRRNTFGPLHQLPAQAGSYGPESFITEGIHYTDDYVLLPAGLLEAPYLSSSKLK